MKCDQTSDFALQTFSMTFFSHLECSVPCGAPNRDPRERHFLCSCGAPLLARYDEPSVHINGDSFLMSIRRDDLRTETSEERCAGVGRQRVVSIPIILPDGWVVVADQSPSRLRTTGERDDHGDEQTSAFGFHVPTH